MRRTWIGILVAWISLVGTWGCGASVPPRLMYAQLASPGMGHAMEYAVYVPPHWTAAERLPVVVFLHGIGDGPDAFDDAGLGQLLDQGTTPRAIIVAPQGDRGFWENWASGDHPYRDWVLRELLPTVQKQYNTLPCPEGCHVLGISMGGHGALMFALNNPGTFASVSALSPPIYTVESVKAFYDSFLWSLLLPIEDMWGEFDAQRVAKRNLYLRWQTPADLHGSRLLLAWGDQEDEDFVRDCVRFHEHLVRHQIPHTVLPFHGDHNWKSWVPVVLETLRRQLVAPAQAATQETD